MVPYKGLPDSWRKELKEVAREHLRRHFSSARASGGGLGILAAKMGGLKRKLNPIALLKRVVREVQGD